MNISQFKVRPNIPAALEPLNEIAHDLWYSWNFDAIMLFIRLDFDTWMASNQNPVRTIAYASQERLEELANDDSYLAALSSVYEKMKRYRERDVWYKETEAEITAYFSMEYGLDKSLPTYSGGLGVLSGDHLKTSSDLGIPLVGVGLLYRQGYFQQYLNADGYQQESYPENDWSTMPVTRCTDADGNQLSISVDIGERTVKAAIWKVRVGRVTLYLLDSNIPENNERDRTITATLYGGDRETRIRQEILLGMGGIRALEALEIEPAAFHMNEGHSAFLALERIRSLMKKHSLSFDEARQIVWATNVFTTHTPVPAGNERFEPKLIERYFGGMEQELGIDWKRFMSMGRENPDDDLEHYCMTVLALRMSTYSNAVSRLHGRVTRNMWKRIWPGHPEMEIPIEHVTNGIHPRTWISHDMLDLLDRYFGPQFQEESHNLAIWERIDRISDEELWRTHERRRERLVAFARSHAKEQLSKKGATAGQIAQAEDVLSPYALTISFARRFATYKRATLLFRDPDRLIRLLTDNDHPVQLIFAGKAHPHDAGGKELIRNLYHFSSRPDIRSRILFMENYDISIAKYLLSGSDLWLNTPRRPMEASGTSGMKAAMNGVLNLSVLDGWWDEGYDPSIGWPIGNGEEYTDHEQQDEIESKALYDLLEREIVPSFYERGRDGLPREWIAKMKASMASVGEQFSSHRMVMEYTNRYYLPATKYSSKLAKNDFGEAKELASYLDRIRSAWGDIGIEKVNTSSKDDLKVGDTLEVSAEIKLGSIKVDEISVELYYGSLSSRGEIENPQKTEMSYSKNNEKRAVFTVSVPCSVSGTQGFAVRVLPKHPSLVHGCLPALVKWS